MNPPIGELLLGAPAGVDLDSVLARMHVIKAEGHKQRCVFVGHPSKWPAMLDKAQAFVSTRAQADALCAAGIASFLVLMALDIEPPEQPSARTGVPLGYVAEEWTKPLPMMEVEPGSIVLFGPMNLRVARWMPTAKEVRLAALSLSLAEVLVDRRSVAPNVRLVAYTRTIEAARVLAAGGHIDLLVHAPHKE